MNSSKSSTTAFWAGKNGDAYSSRCKKVPEERADYWQKVVERYRPENMLEVGCNVGGNLQYIPLDHHCLFGVDVNKWALTELKKAYPLMNGVYGTIYDLPFKNSFFDMVFTCGVLIHVPPKYVKEAMLELIRVSKHYVMIMEYFNPYFESITYRGKSLRLWHCPYATEMKKLGLIPEVEGRAGVDRGFDNVHFWSFKK